MGNLTMLDSISEAELAWAITAGQKPDVLSGYVAGNWPDFPQIAALAAQHPGMRALSISPFASVDADCLDVETGDAAIPDVYGWFTRQQARQLWRPVIYTSADNVNALVATMTANGFTRSSYRIWSAHYTGTAHICGPATCAYTNTRGVITACDGTQWADKDAGHNIDQSLLSPDFFGGIVSANGPQHWDAADWTALDGYLDRVPTRDITWHTGLWWMQHVITGTTDPSMPAWVATSVQNLHAAITAATPVPPTPAEIAAAVVAALPPAAAGGLTALDVENAVAAAMARAFPASASPAG